MRITEADAYVERRDSISHDWMERLSEWDMSPLLLPNTGKPVALFSELKPDLLILTGGNDLHAYPERDATEKALLAAALESDTPVLGVCRGLQLINDTMGGELTAVDGHVARGHDIRISDPWRRFYGDGTKVNSYHSFGIPESGLGAGLQATAVDTDGNVEGCILRGKPLAAVMWHPERKNAPPADRDMIMSLTSARPDPV